MPVQKITFPAKHAGDGLAVWEVNEVRDVVNNNADEVSAVTADVASLKTRATVLEGGTPVVAQTADSVSINPGVLNRWSTALASLTVLFIGEVAGYANEYMLEFTVSGNAFALVLPSGIRWAEEPEWERGWTYQVSIVNGLALYAGWEAAASS